VNSPFYFGERRMSFPILQRLIALLGVQPSRPTVRFQRTPIQKAYHKESYDFSDGSFALRVLAEEVARGEVKVVPKAWEPDFGSWSAPSAIRSITQGKTLSPPPEYFSKMLAQEKYDFSSSSKRPNLSEMEPTFYSQYEESPIDFGEGCSRRRYHAYLEPQVLPDTKGEFDFGSGSRIAPQNIPRESFQEFMHGTMPKPTPQPTIKSTVDMRKEKYSFIEG
jgi:hypothetical protein